MSVEDGNHRPFNPRNIPSRVRYFVMSPDIMPTAMMLGMLAVMGVGYVGVSDVWNRIDERYFAQDRIEGERRAAEAKANATATAIDLITRDYNETGGVDIVRQQESYLATARGSARLAPSEGALIDNAWARIKKDSGCQPSETIILPEVPGAHPWDRAVAPKSYLIRINCEMPK